MKKYSTPLYYVFLLLGMVFVGETKAQNVGIGTYGPDHKLQVTSNTSALFKLENTTPLNAGVSAEMYLKTGLHYTGAVKTIGTGPFTSRLGLFTYAVTNPTALLERMSILDNGFVGVGTTTPAFVMDVNGRMRVRNGNGTAGVVFTDAANAANHGMVGMKDDSHIGLYGFDGAVWGLTMDTYGGNVSISSQLDVNSDASYTAHFNNYSGDNYPAVEAVAASVAGYGVAIEGKGGETGVYGLADMAGSGHRYGLEGYGRHGSGNNYGVYATAFYGANAYGVYASATGATNNWAGYFSGSVYTSGSYQGSDRKLKNDIRPMDHAVQLIKNLKPSTYVYKTTEYDQMQLPEGRQYGLIADEVKQVFPSMVKQVVQPTQYENDDRTNGRIVAEEVSFEAVNYTAMIPVLIAAMQEQQATIETLQRKIEELEAKMK